MSSIFRFIGNFLINPYYAAVDLFRQVIDIFNPNVPGAPDSTQASQVYNVAAQQNLARLGASMPVLYGEFRIYPDLLSQPWAEYINNDQYLHQLMCVSQGQVNMLTLNIGDTPISSFSDVEYQLYQPGETVDLFHNNVFTNNQVNDLTLVTIGAGTDPVALTFDAAAHTITSDIAIFENFAIGDLIQIVDSQFNDGNLTVASISVDFKQLVVTGTVIDESPILPDTYSTITDTTSAAVYGPARFQYSGNTITATNPGVDGVDLSTISFGDSLDVTGSVLNDGTYSASFFITSSTVDVSPSLVTESPEVFHLSQVLILSRDVGPFYANIPELNIERFSVDITFPKGFYNSDGSGNLTDSSATLKVEWRQFGDPDFTLAGTETFTAKKNEAQRYTRTYELPSGATGLIEVKVTRTSETANSTREVNESHWSGLRGFIIAPTTLPDNYDGPTIISNEHYQYPDRTVLAVKVRATGQISSAMSKQFNGVFERLIPVWDGTSWTVPVATSSIPWIFSDVITNTQYGIGRSVSSLNVDELAALDETYTLRGDEFNSYFDQSGTIYDTLMTIAKVGRAVPTFDGRTFSMIRDEPRSIRSAVFTDQNTIKDSVNVNFDFMGDESAKGVLVTYWDEITYAKKTLLCGEDVNTTNVTFTGITSRQQAWNEGNYLVNLNKYRRVNVSFGTEMDGFIPRNGDLVTVQAGWMDWGQSARVLSVDGLNLTIDQNLNWSGSGFECILRDSEGAPSESIPCSRGDNDNIVVLDSLPPFEIQVDGAQERTQIAFGNSVSIPMDVIVSSISAEDEFHATIQASVEDDRVYADPGPAPIEYPSG